MGFRCKQDLDLNPFFLPGKSQRQKEPGGATAPEVTKESKTQRLRD